MDVTEISFNRLIGLERSDDPRYKLMLPAADRYANHLGTVHAGAMFALAEAASGMLLLGEFEGRGDLAAVVRKVETKYRNPGRGTVYAAATLMNDKDMLLKDIDERGRGFTTIAADILDTDGNLLMHSEFEWFVTKTGSNDSSQMNGSSQK